jgi:hypothetical protein
VASYPRHIPAGGEGSITIRVNTSGYGGKTLKKNIDVFTDDPKAVSTTLNISGEVLLFAKLEPTYARLVGPSGTDVKRTVTITREKAYPFTVLDAKANKGKDIRIALDEFSNDKGDGYILTIENTKTTPGRYADKIILSTDSKVKPTITIPVYGQIIAPPPKPKSMSTEKTSEEG